MMKTVKLLTFFLLLVACTKPSYENCSAECNKKFPNTNNTQRYEWKVCMIPCDQIASNEKKMLVKAEKAEKAEKVEFLKTLQNRFLLPKDKGLLSLKDQCLNDCAYTPLNIYYSTESKAKIKNQCAKTFEAKFNEITSAIETFNDQEIPFDMFNEVFGPAYMQAYKPITELDNLCTGYANKKLQYEIEM